MLNNNDNKLVYTNQTFNHVDMSAQEISSKEFDNCIFNGCNLTETLFINCKFYECQFINCNLSMIKISGSTFFDTIFQDSKMLGIDWNQAAWPRIKLGSPLKFYKCVLNHSSFFGLSLKEIVITECSAQEIDLREADCSEADFNHTDFAGCQFGKTNLTKADFTEAINYNIDIFNNEIKQAKFSLPEATSLLKCLDIQLID